MIPGQEALKYGVNYLLGRHAVSINGDNLVALYNTLQNPAKMNEFKYHTRDTILLGDYFKLQDSRQYWKDYMSNRNIDWADVKYPTMMSGFGVSNANWYSDVKSIMDLYE